MTLCDCVGVLLASGFCCFLWNAVDVGTGLSRALLSSQLPRHGLHACAAAPTLREATRRFVGCRAPVALFATRRLLLSACVLMLAVQCGSRTLPTDGDSVRSGRELPATPSPDALAHLLVVGLLVVVGAARATWSACATQNRAASRQHKRHPALLAPITTAGIAVLVLFAPLAASQCGSGPPLNNEDLMANVTACRDAGSNAADSRCSDINSWNTCQVTDMSSLFMGSSLFNLDISGWNTSSVTDMSRMFAGAGAFNQAIGSWDTSNVQDMSRMFAGAGAFNQAIGSWDTSNVQDMRSMFESAGAFNQAIGSWDTSNVQDMSRMFGYALFFNQAIGSWDTSNVQDMRSMFLSAGSFNADISGWDISSVTDMDGMFAFASSFNVSLCSWELLCSDVEIYGYFYDYETYAYDYYASPCEMLFLYSGLDWQDVGCPTCAAGDYLNVAGVPACVGCPPNATSLPGSRNVTDCICDVGYEGPDAGACTACDVGKYKAVNGSGVCSECGAGSYQNETAGSACVSCPLYTSSLAGSADIMDCVCDVGFEGWEGAACPACGLAEPPALNCSTPCRPCPLHAQCRWLSLSGALASPHLNGLYEQASNETRGRPVWVQGTIDAQIMWSGAEWVVASGGQYLYASGAGGGPHPTLSDPHPVLSAGPWQRVVNGSALLPGGEGRAPAPALLLSCLATPGGGFAMRAATRELWSFGANFHGELASPANALSMAPNPAPQSVSARFGGQHLASVAAGCNHGLAVSTEGKLWAWGLNTLGQLGQTRGLGQSNANPLPMMVASAAQFASAVGGGTFSIAQTTGGELWSFGGNKYGQLGRADNVGSDTWTHTLGRVAGLPGSVLQVAAGKHHALALTAAGEVYAWGSNLYGQIGRAENADTERANGVPTRIAINASAVAVAAGRFHSLVLASDGGVWTFGSNLRGQVGPRVEGLRQAPGSAQANWAPQRMGAELFGAERVVGVRAGEFFSLAQTSGGAVWGFGRNYFGQLSSAAAGVGISVPIAVPVCLSCQPAGALAAAAAAGQGVEEMHAGADHTLLVLRRRDARDVLALAGLGSSVYGQLGPTGAAGANVEAVLVAEEATACATQELAAAQGTGGARTCVTGRMRVRRVAAACDSTLVLTERPACPPGSSSSPDGLGLMPCAPCPEGTYQPEPGQTSCLQCPPAMFSFRGSTVCAMCPQGQNTSSTGTAVGGCKPLCPVGFYGVSQSVGTLGLTPCQECPPGTFADSNGTAWPCTPCPQFSGSTRSGLRAEGECRPFCEPGTLSADGLAPCQLCPAGTYNEHRRNVSCAACPQGYSSEAGSTECTICPPGSFAPVENSSVCTLCNYGSYQPAEGQTACTQCPDFKSAPLRGATNESQCLPTVWQTWGAGNNAWGQLGSGFTWNETREVNFVAVIVASDPVQPRRGLDSQDVLQVSPGYAHTLFVTVSKRLYAAGHNDFGQLGFAPAHAPACQYADAPDLTCRFNPTPTATPVEVDPVRFNRTVALARAGRHFSVVLTEDGRLWSLGVNTYGQLGRRGKLGEDATGEWEAREVMPDVVDVAVGWYHVLVKASDGSVLAFGLNRFGQLGVEQNQGTWTPNPDPLLIPSGAFGGGAVAAMAAGGTFSVVLTSEGEVWTFGSNHKGQLGVAAQFGVWGGAVWVPQMVPQVWTQAPGGGVSVAATRIAAGAKHVVVQSSDGRLWGFGNNFYGQLASVSLIGDKTSTPYRIGVDLPTFGLDNTPFRDTSTVVAIACGSDHTIVQTDDFRLWFFGSNRHGQLLRSENAGEWEFNPEPRAVVPCDLFSDQEVCDGYIVDKFAAGGEHTLIITGSKSCPPGSRGPPPFGRPGQLGDCQTCPAGTYSAGAGSTTCTPCSPGTFAPAGAEACSVCPADTYASGPGNADCTACDPGEQTQSDGATSEEDCRAMCQPGSYSGDGMEPCQACGNGTYAAAVGAEACLACAVGKWAPAGSDRCNDCAEGTSTFPGAGGASADCKAVCAAGTRSASGLAPCEVCARGTTSTAGATACESCGPGQDTLGNASTECVVVCGAGFYGEDRGIGVGVAPCLPCARGYFAPGAATACEACAPGYVAASEGAAACVKCLRGTFAASKGQFACEECQPGTAQRREGQAGCEDCVRGTFAAAAGAEECLECGAGLTSEQDTRSTGCQPCAAGTFLDSNTKRCSECEPGTFALASAAQCEPCPVGSYQPAAGASACERCVVGTTEVEGATSAGECRGLTEGRLTVSRASGMPTAGAEARLELELMPLMNVVAGERIVLGLPGFTNTRGSSAIELGGDAAASLTGTWNNASEALPFNALVLTVRQGQGVDRLNLVQLTVAESEGIRLPLLGLTSVSPPVTLSTNAAAGMVPPTPVDNVTPVGSFGASSTAIWDGSRLSLAAMPMMQMVEGDSLIVTLPIMLRSAGGNETTAMLPLTYGRRLDGLFGAEATWTAADNTLRLTIAPGQAQSPPVHAESSVAVMVGGLMLRPGPWQIGALTIASDAVAGPVPATTVQRVCKQEPGTPTMCCPGYTPSCLYA